MRKGDIEQLYRMPNGVRRWADDCGFDTLVQAYEALGCGKRSWFRWQLKGLPSGLYGTLLVREMERILAERKKK